MGLFSKKTKTKTNQTTTATTTPVLPDWLSTSYQGLNDKIGSTFGGIDPKTYVPGPNPLQTQAGAGAMNLTAPGGSSDILRGVAGAGPQTVQGASLLDNLDSYFSPYKKNVIDTSLADYDFGAGQTRAQDQLAKAGDSTFGGSGGAIQTALSNEGLARGRGALSAGLYDQGFTQAAGLSGQDADRRQQASIANAGFGESALQRQLSAGTALGNNDRANIDTQSAVGGGLRDIQTQQNQGPIQLLMQQIAAQSGLNLGDLFKGSTSTGTLNGTSTSKESGASLGDWLNYFAANVQAAGKAAAAGA
jgi:hypothetical protein